MRKLLAFIALSPLLTGTAHAQLFTPSGAFTVDATGSPGNFSQSVDLTSGSINALPGVTLTIITPGGTDAPGAEWLIFHYEATDGLLSPTQGDWSLFEDGLPANQPLNFINAALQFDANGTNIPWNASLFGNYHPVSAMPSDIAGFMPGPGLLANPFDDTTIGGPGPLPSLGTFINPFSQLDGFLGGGFTADEITGYTEAFEFSPQSVSPGVPEPSTWAMLLTGFGLLGFAAMWKDKRTALAA
jgi:hypothetical protein